MIQAAPEATNKLLQRLQSPSYTPAGPELPGLWALLSQSREDQDLSGAILKSLLRRGADALVVGLRLPCLDDDSGLVAAALGRLATEAGVAAELIEKTKETLLTVLSETPTQVRSVRAAIRALGNLGADCEAELLAFWQSEPGSTHRQALVIALGKVGGANALAFLEGAADSIQAQASVRAAYQNAVLLLNRRLQRTQTGQASEILPDATMPGLTFGPVEVRFRCRAGLEQILINECSPAWDAVSGKQGEVFLKVTGAMRQLFNVRTAESFGFPLRVTGASNSSEAVVIALTSPAVRQFMTSLTRGRPTYRIEWVDDGARRSVTRDIATKIAKAVPELVNETRNPLWQIEVRRSAREIAVELVPVGLTDPRFPWRGTTVAASSHAPLAAALVRLAEVKAGDVVWDPFVGAGTELIECGLTTRVKHLFGTDLSREALAAARSNIELAKLSLSGNAHFESPVDLIEGSCLSKVPPGITCIVTNPPLGRRVEKDGAISLLQQFIPLAYQALTPGGRMVWVTPAEEETDKIAIRSGFTVGYRSRIDMGGFHAHIQVLKKGSLIRS